MVFDHLDNGPKYVSLHRLFARGLEFLRRPGLADLPAGRHEIDGPDLYAVVVRGGGKGQAGTKLETHRKYIDIQFSLAGEDLIGWRASHACTASAGGYNATKDVELFTDAPEAWVRVPQGHFAIYWPHDAHAPMGTEGNVHKIVVKIAV